MRVKVDEMAYHASPGTSGSRLTPRHALWILILILSCSVPARSQTSPADQAPAASPQAGSDPSQFSPAAVDLKALPKNLFLDQKNFFTAPIHMTEKQWEWAMPAVLVGAGLIASDKSLENHVPKNPTTVSRAVTASNAGTAVLAASGAGLFLWGHLKSDDQKRETGLLAGEAAIGVFADTELFKFVAGRERPLVGTSPGRFFVSGDSFPSTHASVSWAIASVIAHEYPGFLTQVLAYGVAGGVSASRWAGQKHFASDVVIGSALGWYMGRQVSLSHSHYSNADVARYGTFNKVEESEEAEAVRKTRNTGSSYVPLDSWTYSAIEQLVALGYIQTASLGLRPWTRTECARLLSEATGRAAETDAPIEVQQLYDALTEEFDHELGLVKGDSSSTIQLESVYARPTQISGRPLTDNFHFGQTLLNDYGRPFEQGFNFVSGASGWATKGPFVIYARGEYETAPSGPAPTSAEISFFNAADNWPNNPAPGIAAISRFRLLDAYVGMNFANWQFSFGKNSLWWGPSEGGTMILTNNIPPLNNMFTVNRVSPFRLPWLFRYLGDVRFEGFIGHMTGLEFQTTFNTGASAISVLGQYGKNLHPQPYLTGGKLSFKLTPNFEFGMSKTTVYGGPGNPLTSRTFLDSIFGLHVNGDVLGDGRTSADFSYRLPGFRDWITLYGEALSEDEISPIPYLRKSASQGGLYFAKLPGLRKLDLRIEGGYTNPVAFCGTCIYYNGQYNSGYNNDGRLIGTWIGRAAQGEMARMNYWLSPRKKIGIELRHRKIDHQFLPQGGTQNDVAVNADIFTRSGFRISGNVQYERWDIPLIATGFHSNVVGSLEIGFWPTAHTR